MSEVLPQGMVTPRDLDPSLLMDNAAAASQCEELMGDHPTRQAVLLNVYRPLWDEIEHLRSELSAERAIIPIAKKTIQRLQDELHHYFGCDPECEKTHVQL